MLVEVVAALLAKEVYNSLRIGIMPPHLIRELTLGVHYLPLIILGLFAIIVKERVILHVFVLPLGQQMEIGYLDVPLQI